MNEATDLTIILWFNAVGKEAGSGTDRKAEFFGHAHKVGNRGRLHFFHDAGPLDLDGDNGGAQAGGGLLVEQTLDDQGHDLPFARGQQVVPCPEFGKVPAGLQTGASMFGVMRNILNEGFSGPDEAVVPSGHNPQKVTDAPQLRSVSGNLLLEQSISRLDPMCLSNTSLHSGYRLARS